MKTEDKRDQIQLWFSTPEPLLDATEPSKIPMEASKSSGDDWDSNIHLPSKIPMEASKASVKQCGIGFLVCAGVTVTSILMMTAGIWPFWDSKYGDILELFVGHLVGAVIFVGGGIYLLRGTINHKIEYNREKARYDRRKEIYDREKARYNREKAAYDALPSTAQMVEWFKEDRANMEKSIHDKMMEGYDKVAEIQLPETFFVWIPEMSKGKTERTEDGYKLCSEWKIDALNINSRGVIINRWIYDWGKDSALCEFSQKYFYLDIVSLGRRSDRGHRVIQFKMKGGGDPVVFPLAEDHLFIDDQGSEGLSSRMDRIEKAIDTRLGDAKNIDGRENN